MLNEALRWLQELFAKAHTTRTFQAPNEPPHVYYLDSGDNNPERREAQPWPRAHEASDISTVIAFAKHYAREAAGLSDSPSIRVWVHQDEIVAVLNDEDRRDKVTYTLVKSPQLFNLIAMEKMNDGSSGDYWAKILRHIFPGTVKPDGLDKILTSLKFLKNEGGVKEVGHGKRTIGKSLEQELVGNTSPIPTSVQFYVPTYIDKDLPHSLVYGSVEVDLDKETFLIRPYAGSCAEALRNAEERIFNQIKDALESEIEEGTVAVVRGKPRG